MKKNILNTTIKLDTNDLFKKDSLLDFLGEGAKITNAINPLTKTANPIPVIRIDFRFSIFFFLMVV